MWLWNGETIDGRIAALAVSEWNERPSGLN